MKTLNSIAILVLALSALPSTSALADVIDGPCKTINLWHRYATVCRQTGSRNAGEFITIDVMIGSIAVARPQDIGIWLGSAGGGAGKFYPINSDKVYGYDGEAYPYNGLVFHGVYHGGYIMAHLTLSSLSGDPVEYELVWQALRGNLEFAVRLDGQWDSRYGQNYQIGQL